MCGDDSRDIAGLPIVQIETAIQPTETQGAALDELGNASIAAAQSIRAACPTQIILTAPGRLAAMQQRIEAMVSAVATVQPALEKFYALLNDEQKARLNALADDQRRVAAANHAGGPLVPSCGAAQAFRRGMAGRRDRGQVCIRTTPSAPALAALQGCRCQGRRNAESGLPDGRRNDATRTAHRDRQAARYHAAGGQIGAYPRLRIFTPR